MAAMRVPLPTTKPNLPVLAAVGERYKQWLGSCIGSCQRDKDWPDAYWAELIAGLRGRTAGTLFQISGAQHPGGPGN